MASQTLPQVIQGGMGVAVSGWQLARAVASQGQLGVVSGTALELVLARRLQAGDLDGAVREALAAFPFPEMATRILDRYFVEGGKADDAAMRAIPMPSITPSRELQELIVVGNFVEVWLAKQGHTGLVGINYLEKIQPPTLPAIFGAMLAGVDVVLMGAGIPRLIPGVLDRLAEGEAVSMPIHVLNSDRDWQAKFDPVEFTQNRVPWLRRPQFFAIVSSVTLATMLAKKSNGYVDGFVVETPRAGGHNAPPRGKMKLDDQGEPIYGPRDEVDFAGFRKLGRPFWLAGGYASPEGFQAALEAGAAGVQVGTAFAFCAESGLRVDLRKQTLQRSTAGNLNVHTDPLASPTGFPFKVLSVEETLSEAEVYQQRKRCCDLGFLRQATQDSNGKLSWRCPAEQVESYVRKGGDESDTVGRKCLCNGLMANIGLGQINRGQAELPLLTCGDEVQTVLESMREFTQQMNTPQWDYKATDVLRWLTTGCETQHQSEPEMCVSHA